MRKVLVLQYDTLPRTMAPYAEVTSTDFTYTGQRDLTGTGLMDYRARFYSPALKRFIQPDSIIPGAGNPQSWNRYTYVLNRPINANDPSGHKCSDVEGGACTNNNGTQINGSGNSKWYYTPPEPEKPGDIIPKPNGAGGKDDDCRNDIYECELTGNGDVIKLSVTPDELHEIANSINHDLTDDGGYIDQAESAAFWISLAFGGFVAILTAPINCTTNACTGSVIAGNVVADAVGSAMISGYFETFYKDLQTTGKYFDDTSISLNDRKEINIWVISGNDSSVSIIAEGSSTFVQVPSGIYYYNARIAPYLYNSKESK